MNKKIKLNDENKKEMQEKITKYFYEERGEALGELASGLVLDFVLEELAPNIYNQGIEDAHIYVNNQLEDLFALKIVRR